MQVVVTLIEITWLYKNKANLWLYEKEASLIFIKLYFYKANLWSYKNHMFNDLN